MPLDRHAQRFLKMLALSGPPSSGGAAQRRLDLETLCDLGELPAEPGVTVRDLVVGGETGPMAARLYRPDGAAAPAPTLIYLHGGGWSAGSLRTHDGLCRRLAAASRRQILALDYGLAPERPFPGGLNDALAGVRWAANHARELDADPDRLGLAGDSAGANLAAAAAAQLAETGAPRLALLLLICPILDIARRSPSRLAYSDGYFLDQATLEADVAGYLPPGADPADPRLSPLLARSLAGLPPTLIHTAEFDPCRDEAAFYAENLRAAGVPVRHTDHAGMVHYFYALPRAIPYALEAVRAMGEEVGEMLQPS